MVNKYFVCIQIIEEGMLPYYQQMMKKLEIPIDNIFHYKQILYLY